MRYDFLSIAVIFLVLVTAFSPSIHASGPASENEYDNGRLIAYRARVIPHIDGIVSPHEWTDAKPYLYEWENGGPGMPISSGMLSLSFCLKHDKSRLYLLFTINDNDTDAYDSLDIFLEDFVLVLYPNGTGYEGHLSKSGVGAFPGASKIDGRVSSTYLNGVYTFEVSLSLIHYFNLTENNTAQFNIGYTDGNPEPCCVMEDATVAVGAWGTTEPGIVISSDYLEGTKGNNRALGEAVIGAAVCIVAVAVLVWTYKKAHNRP